MTNRKGTKQQTMINKILHNKHRLRNKITTKTGVKSGATEEWTCSWSTNRSHRVTVKGIKQHVIWKLGSMTPLCINNSFILIDKLLSNCDNFNMETFSQVKI